MSVSISVAFLCILSVVLLFIFSLRASSTYSLRSPYLLCGSPFSFSFLFRPRGRQHHKPSDAARPGPAIRCSVAKQQTVAATQPVGGKLGRSTIPAGCQAREGEPSNVQSGTVGGARAGKERSITRADSLTCFMGWGWGTGWIWTLHGNERISYPAADIAQHGHSIIRMAKHGIASSGCQASVIGIALSSQIAKHGILKL
jgi:hypothetical protein